MIQENFEYLSDNVMKFAGFPEELKPDLKKAMETGAKEFSLEHSTKYGEDEVRAVLNFSKSKETDMYFFNNYDLYLKKNGQENEMKQTFYINKGGSITMKEGYNLMEGRGVNKNFLSKDPMMEDGKPVLNDQGKEMHDVYNVWVQLDFKHTETNGSFKQNRFSTNYGFDIEKAVLKLPLKENGNDQYRDNVIESLKKGNRQAVTFVDGEKETKRFIEAHPQFRTIKVYDEKQNRISVANQQNTEKGQAKDRAQKQNENSSMKTTRQSAGTTEDEGPDMPAKKKKRQAKVS